MAGHSTNLAIAIDVEMLQANGVVVHPSNVDEHALPLCSDLADQLGGRLLLRYVRRDTLNTYSLAPPGTTWPRPAFVTPTVLCRSELKATLNLPPHMATPTHALLLDRTNLVAAGPRQVRFGVGVEYFLPKGFCVDDIVWPKWPVALP